MTPLGVYADQKSLVFPGLNKGIWIEIDHVFNIFSVIENQKY